MTVVCKFFAQILQCSNDTSHVFGEQLNAELSVYSIKTNFKFKNWTDHLVLLFCA